MKLLIATPLYPPEPGGPATYCKLLEDGLPPLGIEVVLVKFGDVKHLPNGIRHVAYFYRTLKEARSADIVYALDAVSVGFPAMLAAKFAGKPFIVKIAGDYAWEQGRQRFGVTKNLDEFVKDKNISVRLKFFRWIQLRVANNATQIVVPSNYLKSILLAWGIQPEKITVIHNAVALGFLAEVPNAVLQIPQPTIVSVGRLVPWKGFETVIEAAASLRAKNISVSLVIVGDGPQRDALEAKAKSAMQNDFLFTGALSHEQTLAVMKHVDVFVLDSSYEGLSHVLIEAVMLGMPIIASNIGGNREVITHEENGLLVEPENPEALAEALVRMLGDVQLRARLAALAKESSGDFSIDTMLQKVADFLNKI